MESNFVQATCDYSTACKLLDCGESTVRRLCQQGELTCIRHGRKMRIFLDSIDAYTQRAHDRAAAEAASKRKSLNQ